MTPHPLQPGAELDAEVAKAMEMLIGTATGAAVCTACGVRTTFLPARLRPASTPTIRGIKKALDRQLSFRLNGCPWCGHLMVSIIGGGLRDLSRAEAGELAAHPDFPRVRERVLEAVGHLVG